jgi:hypothetical protein
MTTKHAPTWEAVFEGDVRESRYFLGYAWSCPCGAGNEHIKGTGRLRKTLSEVRDHEAGYDQ